jgi:hypothetical protein
MVDAVDNIKPICEVVKVGAAGTIYEVPAIHVQKHFDLYERDSSTVILVAKLNRPSDGSHRPYP